MGAGADVLQLTLPTPASHSPSRCPVRCNNPASISKRGDNLRRSPVGRSIAITFCAGLFATPAFAQMDLRRSGRLPCDAAEPFAVRAAAAGAQVPVPFTALVPATSTPPNAARSRRNSSTPREAAGERLRGGDRTSASASWSGSAERARRRERRGAGRVGTARSATSAAAACKAISARSPRRPTPATSGSNTDTGHPTGSPAFAVIQDTHELNYGTLDDFLVESIHQQYNGRSR